jgi:CheY-like chemotaxis protein
MDATRPYILVVDDIVDAADSLAELLSLWGYDSEPLYSGAEALKAAAVRRPDVVLLDLGMPGMSGFEFLLRLRDVPGCTDTMMVVITGYTSRSCQDWAKRLGIEYYLFKPADPDQLRTLLGRLVEARAPPKVRKGRSPLVLTAAEGV